MGIRCSEGRTASIPRYVWLVRDPRDIRPCGILLHRPCTFVRVLWAPGGDQKRAKPSCWMHARRTRRCSERFSTSRSCNEYDDQCRKNPEGDLVTSKKCFKTIEKRRLKGGFTLLIKHRTLAIGDEPGVPRSPTRMGVWTSLPTVQAIAKLLCPIFSIFSKPAVTVSNGLRGVWAKSADTDSTSSSSAMEVQRSGVSKVPVHLMATRDVLCSHRWQEERSTKPCS